MLRRTVVALLVLVGCGSLAHAADHSRVEIGAIFGYATSDGVTFNGVQAGDGNIYNSIAPVSAFSYDLNLGFLAGHHAEFGFLFAQQKSQLEVSGTTTRIIGDMDVNNYHGYFAYNFGDPESKARFYFLAGLGATQYASVGYTVGGVTGETQGNSKFSTTWGAGVKLYPAHRVGLKLGVRWTPTYIKTDTTGWWCDPYWGCYLTGNAQYSNQVEFAGGLVFRF